jgi:hypothetical protein
VAQNQPTISLFGLRGSPALGIALALWCGHARAATTDSVTMQHVSLLGPAASVLRKPHGPVLSGIRVVETPSPQQQAAALVSLELMANHPIEVGATVTFRVTSRKGGYLLLVDIDAAGKMTQIFPSPELLAQFDDADMNVIRPGETLILPPTAAAARGFQYIIAPPTGAAAVIAILSEKRVQLLDLPDLPQRLDSEADVVTYLTKWTNELRIPDNATGKLGSNNWWFDVKSYVIK